MSDEAIRKARVFSGSGRYTDPWHPFAETSAAIAEVITGLGGWDVQVVQSEPESLTALDGVELLVINSGVGDPETLPGPDAAWARAHAELARWVERGGPVLGTHTAAATFPEWPKWPALLGGRWVRGRSMHPPRGFAAFDLASDHPVLRGLDSVEAYDERYSYLEPVGDIVPLLSHEHDGRTHVMAWIHETDTVRVIYDGLGHGPESYESPSRRELLRNEIVWLTR